MRRPLKTWGHTRCWMIHRIKSKLHPSDHPFGSAAPVERQEKVAEKRHHWEELRPVFRRCWIRSWAIIPCNVRNNSARNQPFGNGSNYQTTYLWWIGGMVYGIVLPILFLQLVTAHLCLACMADGSNAPLSPCRSLPRLVSLPAGLSSPYPWTNDYWVTSLVSWMNLTWTPPRHSKNVGIESSWKDHHKGSMD